MLRFVSIAPLLRTGYSFTMPFYASDDDSCTLLPGLCDDNTHSSLHLAANSTRDEMQLQQDLEDVYSRVNGKFYCYKTGDGNFLAYDPPAPDTSKIVNRQLPNSIKQLQEDWMASSFQFGEPCRAESSSQDCPEGFMVDTAGIGVVNDAGNLYGGGSNSAPPNCGGCQEEVLVCLSSARSVRGSCSEVPLSPPSAGINFLPTNLSSPQVGCGLGGYKHPWILRNRNLYAHNTKVGTGKYFYVVTIEGMPCNVNRDAQAMLGLIKSFAQGFQGMIDIWRAKPACDGKCEMMSGAVSAWMTYSIPVAVSVLTQLRAWASLKVDDLPGCIGNQAVLKFGSMSVTDDGVVCCPEPHSGGRCNQNYKLPAGWAAKLTEGSDLDFATWLASELGNGVGQCDRCGWPGPDPVGTMCPGASFSYDDAQCQPKDFVNYIPGVPGPAPPPSPSPPSPSPPSPGPVSGFTKHAGLNCFSGHGGVPVDERDPAQSGKSTTECLSQCQADASCTAVTDTGTATNNLCWFRSSVDISGCDSGTGYDTYTAGSVPGPAPPGPSPPAPPSPPSPSPSGYTKHDGYNCYSGNGGVPDVQGDPAQSGKSVAECENLCDTSATCTAITHTATGSNYLCWLRTSVDISHCISGTGYDTYSKVASMNIVV